MNNSWLHLKSKDPGYNISQESTAADLFGAKDCGWVEQMRPFIRQFSDKNDTVLDPFCGFASTLIAAGLEGRCGFGIEVDERRVDIADKRLRSLNVKNSTVVQGDAEFIEEKINHADLIISNVPYFGCAWGDANTHQIYNLSNYNDYLQKMRCCFKAFKSVLKENGYIIIMVENIRIGDHFVRLSQDISSMLDERFSLIDERILVYDKDVSNSFEVLSNRAHEYVFIAQNTFKAIDCQLSSLYLFELCKLSPEIIVYGSFAHWIYDKTYKPSDVDIMIPYDLHLIKKLTDWFIDNGFKVSRWGVRVDKVNTPIAALSTNYFRAEYINNEGSLVLFDVFFAENNRGYKKLLNKITIKDGIKCVLGDIYIED